MTVTGEEVGHVIGRDPDLENGEVDPGIAIEGEAGQETEGEGKGIFNLQPLSSYLVFECSYGS